MKNNILSTLFFFLLFSQNIFAQILEPISWEFRVDSSELKSSGSLNLIFTPTTELGWYIYSSDNDPESGPRTEFEFYPNKTFNIEGDIVPVNVQTKYDEVWEANVRYLDNKGSFQQKIILSNVFLRNDCSRGAPENLQGGRQNVVVKHKYCTLPSTHVLTAVTEFGGWGGCTALGTPSV